MRLTTKGVARNFEKSIVGVIAKEALPPDQRTRAIRFVAPNDAASDADLMGYRAILCHDELHRDPGMPYIHRLRESDHLRDGDIVVLEGRTGLVRSLYRPYELHHHLFVTERCNSNCLMCSQPPKDRDDVEALTERNLELIDLIAPYPPYLTITGGEPTLLGDNLFRLITQLKFSMPETELHMLTNGRTFAWPEYTRRFADLDHPKISLGIPLYSDFAGAHDYVVQAKGRLRSDCCRSASGGSQRHSRRGQGGLTQADDPALNQARGVHLSEPHLCRAHCVDGAGIYRLHSSEYRGAVDRPL